MTVKRKIEESSAIYFITITCYQWISLLETLNAYDAVYRQFDILKSEGHSITGYTLMPNHVHAMIGFHDHDLSINSRIGSLKRFLAYDLLTRMEMLDQNHLLGILANAVHPSERANGKLHQVFQPSFDAKRCDSIRFIRQKLDYMHANPCSGKWQLAEEPIDWPHSSARFYNTGEQGVYPVEHYLDVLDKYDLMT